MNDCACAPLHVMQLGSVQLVGINAWGPHGACARAAVQGLGASGHACALTRDDWCRRSGAGAGGPAGGPVPRHIRQAEGGGAPRLRGLRLPGCARPLWNSKTHHLGPGRSRESWRRPVSLIGRMRSPVSAELYGRRLEWPEGIQADVNRR